MTARLILAGLTALLLAAAMAAGGTRDARAAETKTAIFAGGCFWCVEDAFDQVEGVTETISGYAGGTKPNPTYGAWEPALFNNDYTAPRDERRREKIKSLRLD